MRKPNIQYLFYIRFFSTKSDSRVGNFVPGKYSWKEIQHILVRLLAAYTIVLVDNFEIENYRIYGRGKFFISF